METFRYRYLLTNGDDQAQIGGRRFWQMSPQRLRRMAPLGPRSGLLIVFRKPDRRDNGLALVLYDGERLARLITSHTPEERRRPASAARGARGISVSGAWEIVAGRDRFQLSQACDGSPAGCREWRSTPWQTRTSESDPSTCRNGDRHRN